MVPAVLYFSAGQHKFGRCFLYYFSSHPDKAPFLNNFARTFFLPISDKMLFLICFSLWKAAANIIYIHAGI
jgi:hypothetical protein